jgi:hypothetical protein
VFRPRPENEAGVNQTPEIGAGGRRRHVGFLAVACPIRASDEGLLECDHEPVRPVAPLDELLEEGPIV